MPLLKTFSFLQPSFLDTLTTYRNAIRSTFLPSRRKRYLLVPPVDMNSSEKWSPLPSERNGSPISCHQVRTGFTLRYVESESFGTPNTPGGQAQYVRVPHAGGTLYTLQGISDASVRPDQEIWKLADSSLLLLCDILPTGVFAAFQALSHPKSLPMLTLRSYPQSSGAALLESGVSVSLTAEDKVLTIAIIGLGPMGVCACIALLNMLYAKNVEFRIVAIDPTEIRRKKVEAVYAKVSRSYGERAEKWASGSV